MKLNWIPTFGESFVADLHCNTCKDMFPHIILPQNILKENGVMCMVYETSCSNCSCDLEYQGNKTWKVTELDKKWEDSMPLPEWRRFIASLNE